jgi:deoxyribonuclease V
VRALIVCVDVDYRGEGAVVGAIAIERWEDERAAMEHVARIPKVAAYEPGSFYLRELPCLVEVLRPLSDVPTVVIDGYVWLAKGRPGLGARLFDARGRTRCRLRAADARHASPSDNLEAGRSARA